ncbi:DNA MISMATCH REPAIR 2 domain-containing protein [Citrus sinensis]|uniref:DNA MISMATCH REPAIR 2 domain-containing protein n=1 Tax=Citrus sinensis TaxID=2711 RepID=A0ACB8M437_CITSI|nr:DNA MISMATCH REPAIR 2 domain-containing protein [Citrus sinensis]
MPLWAAFGDSISIPIFNTKSFAITNKNRRGRLFCSTVAVSDSDDKKSRVVYESLRVLEWDKLCHSVSSFARTSLGREATLTQLWSINQTYQDSLRLLDETNAAVEMQKHGSCSLDLTGVDLSLVKSAIREVRRASPLRPNEALAVVALLQFSETLQLSLRAAIKEDADLYIRFMPLTQMIMQLFVNRSLIKSIMQVVDEDGSIKDSASPALKQSRGQVQMLERKLYQLMDMLIRNENNESLFLEVSSIQGRLCIRTGADQLSFKGLLLSSSGIGSVIEPLSAVPLNDELQQARASVTKAEEDVLLALTEKMQVDLDEIEKMLNGIIQLDVVNARATYSLSFGGTSPNIFLPQDMKRSLTHEPVTSKVSSSEREWTIYLPKAYHPLLLQQHKQKTQQAWKDLESANTELRRRKLYGGNTTRKGEKDTNLSPSEMHVSALELAHPVPIDIFIARKTRVLVITGPNTGGKTICLKTVGLAVMMAKSGLHILSSEYAKVPWFDSVFADIGDEQSLSQSLSTFSGHLKQIGNIISQSTSQSLVLLDEIGAGTNPLEGTALGMSLLEAFAESGSLLTIATTHHGELKTLKYSNDFFENACMEFDEVKLKPTYKILWGVPGRSSAINIAERLGLPGIVVQNARQLYGAASAEINEVIIEMERFKTQFLEHVHEARHFLMLSRNLHKNLLRTRRKILEHCASQRFRKVQKISDAAAIARSLVHKSAQQLCPSASQARSLVHKRAQQLRPSASQSLHCTKVGKNQHVLTSNFQQTTVDKVELPATASSSVVKDIKQSPRVKRTELPKVGDLVHVSSFGKKGTVIKVEPSKEEIVVQAGNMKWIMKFTDIVTY